MKMKIKMKTQKIVNMIFAFAAICSLVACHGGKRGEAAAAKKILVVGTNAEFAPFCFIEDGDIKGFDIDMASEVCMRMKKKMTIKDMSFEALIPDIKVGSIDFIAAGMSVTEERKKVVNFSIPYLSEDPLVIVYNASKLSAQQVKEGNFSNLRVVVNEGYTADFFVSDNFDLEPIRLNSPIDGFMALSAGRGDVFISAKSTVLALLKKNKNFSYELLSGANENCALIVAKEKKALLSEINTAIEQMKEDGFIEKLKDKWGLK